jgi:1-deoxy-D-xylulose-5-phosphate reductoisomerase
MKNIVILGSTGSIGKSALSVISGYRDRFRVVGLTANSSLDLLLEQIEEFSPEAVAVADLEAADELRARAGVPVFGGQEGLCRVASHDKADFVLSAIVGAAGLVPTMAAVRPGRTIGLANKETLVVAGDIVMKEAVRHGARILPVDSEHSAVFQCIDGGDPDFVSRVILTASGGPFVGRTREELEYVTPQDALKHPSWDMGRKITIDSATLMNKGLEVIEAHHLFGLPPEKIEVVIHPQSIIHSMVEFRDGCSLAQMSVPDMKAAIAYALSYPERMEGVIPCLDLCALGELTFREPDPESFPCLSYAYEALREGGTMPAVLNAANEAAVAAFLDGGIGFNDIPDIIKKTMQSHEKTGADSIEAVLEAHDWAINQTLGLIKSTISG